MARNMENLNTMKSLCLPLFTLSLTLEIHTAVLCIIGLHALWQGLIYNISNESSSNSVHYYFVGVTG